MGQFLAPRITTASRSTLTLSASELVYDTNLSRFFGGDGTTVGGFAVGNIVGSGTANQITYFTASGTIASLSTTTYPSLTELSYVKGVTSSIQTQLNSKQGTLTLTTTGSSGSSTFISNVLNIPTYTLSGLGGQPLATNLTSLAGLSYVSSSFVKMTAAGTFTLDTNTYYLASNPSSFIALTNLSATTPLSYNNTTGAFSIQVANTTQSGYLSSTDWNTFNNKGSGTVTSVAALTLGTTGTDLTSTVATGTTTPVITLNVPTASSTNRGALSSTDWTTFNNKQGAITLTTTGSSGSATFTTNTLNIPTYTLAGLGGQASSTNLTSLSGLTFVSTSFVKMTAAGTFALDTNTYYLASNPSGYTNNTGTVTSVAALTLGTTGTDLSSTVATGTTTPVITLNVPTASATNRGALSSADWSTFNGKQGAITLTTTGTSGAATLIGNTLNIPQYSGGGGGGTVTSITASSPLTGGTITSSGTIGIQQASNVQAGYISANDYRQIAKISSSVGTISLNSAGGNARIGTSNLSVDKNLTITVYDEDAIKITTDVSAGPTVIDIAPGYTPGITSTSLNYNGEFFLNLTGISTGTPPSIYISSNNLDLNAIGAISIYASSFNYSNGTNYVGFQLPTLSTDSLYTLPVSIPTSNKVLQSDSSGVLSWVNMSSSIGTVTTVSVTSANGFAGTVANATTTPAITLTTTVTGLLKGNGTAISAAVAGTDYLVSNQTITLSGDISGSGTTTISTSLATQAGVTTGTYNSATQITPITIDSKGRITNTGTTVTIAPLFSSIASKPTTLSGYGITDALSTSSTTSALTSFGSAPNLNNPLLTSISTVGGGGLEGGQINFARVTDGTGYWFIDSYGSTASPDLRIVESATERFKFGAGGAFYVGGSAGTSGQVLTSAGTSASPTWTSVLTNPMTTDGDIIYGGASGVATRLAGSATNGWVLTYDTATNAPKWAASSGGGGMAIGGSITSATAGSILFAGTSGVLAQDNTNFFWDNTNKRLGIKNNAPSFNLDITGNARINAGASGQTALNITGISILTGSLTATVQIAAGGSSGNLYSYKTTSAGANVQSYFTATREPNSTAGILSIHWENTNQFVFSAGNGSSSIARAAIQITNLTNTAGSESGDLIFLTQSGGTVISEKWRITSTGLLGNNTTSITSALQINKNQNSVTQADANGILLANSTAATSGLQSISPAIVWQGNGWQTATAGSQDVRFRADVLPVQGTTNPTATWQLGSSVNNAAYSNLLTYTSGGVLTVPNVIQTGGGTGVIAAGSQLIGGLTSTNTKFFRLTSPSGTGVTPVFGVGAGFGSGATGVVSMAFDATYHITLLAGNASSLNTPRASIQITNLTNTAGAETGDLIFLTQSGGTAIAEKMRIFAAGNVGINTGSTNAGYKFDVNGTVRCQSTITTAGIVKATVAKTAAYTLTATDSVILAATSSGAFTLTLPTSTTGQEYTVVKTDAAANTVTIATTGAARINGGTTYTGLSAQYKYITVVFNGSDWFITSSN